MIIIFHVGKKELIISYVGYFFKYGSNFILLPFMVAYTSSEEFALWSIFLSINALIILLDFGYSAVFSRFIMYASSGVRDIKDPSSETKSSPNLELLSYIIISINKIYNKIILICILILCLFTFYILYLVVDDVPVAYQWNSVVSWLIYCISVIISLSSIKDSVVLKGINKIFDLQKITIINSFIVMISKIALLYLGLGILGLAFSNLLTVILLKVQYKKSLASLNKEISEHMLKALKNFDDIFRQDFEFIKNKSRGMGGTLISQFFQTQFIIIIIPLFLDLETVSQFALSYQIVSALSGISSIMFSIYFIKLGNSIVKNDKENTSEIFKKTFSVYSISFVISTFLLLILGEDLLKVLGSNTELLPLYSLALLAMYFFVYQIIQRSTAIIALTNNQYFVKNLLVSSVLSSIGLVIILFLFDNILFGLIWILIVQLVYNFWKWFSESYKICVK